jgi:hypothetical protein
MPAIEQCMFPHSLRYDDLLEYSFGIRVVSGIAVIGWNEAHAAVMKREIWNKRCANVGLFHSK